MDKLFEIYSRQLAGTEVFEGIADSEVEEYFKKLKEQMTQPPSPTTQPGQPNPVPEEEAKPGQQATPKEPEG